MAQAGQKPLSSSAARDSSHDDTTAGDEAKALGATGKETAGQQSEVMKWVDCCLLLVCRVVLVNAVLCCTVNAVLCSTGCCSNCKLPKALSYNYSYCCIDCVCLKGCDTRPPCTFEAVASFFRRYEY